ncbi:MAG TPA: hypothetical protein VLA72_23445 [Anaerolineales bacterium]|nr:hypothetical protein [Anaerolineales bacterium]
MKQLIANFLGKLGKFNINPQGRRIEIISWFVILLSGLLFLLFTWISHRNETENPYKTRDTLVSALPTITPSKWWINSATRSPATPAGMGTSVNPMDMSAGNCHSAYSAPLQPQTFAYISLTPPLPNRIRAGAGETNAYLGQIQPGKGVKILDGPLCSDSSFWWLIESTESQLRGWTVIGSGSQQWVIPCPDPTIPCEKLPTLPEITPTAIFPEAEENIREECNSYKFAVGAFAQVAEDNLLVIRSEPYTGIVVGRAEPMSTLKILDGPICAGNAIWWKVNLVTLDLTGWVTEANLEPCGKASHCS